MNADLRRGLKQSRLDPRLRARKVAHLCNLPAHTRVSLSSAEEGSLPRGLTPRRGRPRQSQLGRPVLELARQMGLCRLTFRLPRHTPLLL